ncbi:tRNA pseudouridine(55) synthase TruB [Gracilibacillus alcaliphilus]|uniref:tRNA pseudouridine(55) synthase TruB n=1 Tax=Gracilibacillus alcaliphilus TaxID=1401441 RepID=UPI00195690AE|nr:tRNA pseudouridine(55) synthase TruB [Gracilibacillus alcaliphilus]MBM7677978.1 tRNA pseudouridine55 synthase [Gracilibacillus alcaliphilus]
MDGILILWKEKGMTSHDCVFKVRKMLQTKKVGHTGTLDPEVEGVLPLCLGEATKIVPYLTDTTKTYRAVAMLGFSTDTEDQTGMVQEQKAVDIPVTTQKLQEVLQHFCGEISQQVPLYSAVKVNGKKLYEYARENQPVDRPFRQVTIHDIRFLTANYDKVNKVQSIEFEVTCSKGTYIRTLCLDIGRALGYPAHMAHLIRTGTAGFTEADALTLAELQVQIDKQQEPPLLPISRGLSHLDVLEVDQATKERIRHGQKLSLPAQLPQTLFFQMVYDGQLLAIYQLHETKEQLKPARVFQF